MADVTLPQLGETVTEGTITQWFKQVGDSVSADEPLFEVSTMPVYADPGYLVYARGSELERKISRYRQRRLGRRSQRQPRPTGKWSPPWLRDSR